MRSLVPGLIVMGLAAASIGGAQTSGDLSQLAIEVLPSKGCAATWVHLAREGDGRARFSSAAIEIGDSSEVRLHTPIKIEGLGGEGTLLFQRSESECDFRLVLSHRDAVATFSLGQIELRWEDGLSSIEVTAGQMEYVEVEPEG